jgi:hypothetical protein
MRKVLVVAFGALHLIVAFDQDAFAQTGRGAGPPTADIKSTCRESEKAIKAIFGAGATSVTYDGCMDQEKAAREQLVKDWATFTAADRQHCVDPKQYMPSYVEWLTCLEMAAQVKKIRLEESKSKKVSSLDRVSVFWG